MAGVLFMETLRRSWRQILYWGLALAILGYYAMAVVPDVDALQQYAALLDTIPSFLLQMFGAEDLTALTTPEGFVAFGYYTYALLVLMVYAVLVGMSITANEEDAGILDVLLSLPIPRWRVIMERFAAYTLITIGIVAVGFIGLLAGTQATALEIDIGRLLIGSINLLPPVLMLIAFAACMATTARRRSLAVTVTTSFIIASYFIDFLGKAASHALTDTLSRFSFFTYFDSQGVMIDGLNPANVALLLIVTVVLLAAALWFFERRDIGT